MLHRAPPLDDLDDVSPSNARHQLAGRDLMKRWHGLLARRDHQRTSRREWASRRRMNRTGNLALDMHTAFELGAGPRRRCNEGLAIRMAVAREEGVGAASFHHPPEVHHDDAGGKP